MNADAPRFDRRHLLATGWTALGLGAVLAACGGDDTGTSTPATGGGITPDTPPPGFSVVQRWIPDVNVPGEVRLPFSIADQGGLLLTGPDTYEVRILDYDSGDVVVEPFVATQHSFGEGTPPFWVVTAQLDQTGTYRLQVLGGDPEGASVQVVEPSTVIVPRPGEALPPVDTPTVDDPRGVDPICSRLDGPCPFHEVTLTEALAGAADAGTPVIYLIGTPAHCSTGTCGPVLDELIALGDELGDGVVIVHADVYADDAATVVAPAVQAYQMAYEPVLWVTDPNGTIVARFDSVWAQDEVRAAVDAARA